METRKLALVVGAAGLFIGFRYLYLHLEQLPDDGVFVCLPAAVAISQRFGFKIEPPCFLQQQFAHDKCPRRGLASFERARSWMVLRLPCNVVMRDLHAVD
jgi:hypothetical protein